MRTILRHLDWSAVLVIAGGVLASVGPTVPSPWPTLSLATVLGKVLYVGTIILLAVAALVVQARQNAKRDRAEKHRDADREARAERRHQQTLTMRDDLRRLVVWANTARLVVAEMGPVGSPLLDAIDQQRHAAAMMAMQGYVGRIAGSATGASVSSGTASGTIQHRATVVVNYLREATRLLEEISQNPPTTPDAVQAAAEQLKAYVIGLAEETDEALPVTPVTVRQPGVAVETDSALPITPKLSSSDSAAPPLTEP